MKIRQKSNAAKPSTSSKKPVNAATATTLVAVVGISPAILTETVWALANPMDGSAPVIPNEVVVLTTARGKTDIERELFTSLPTWGNRPVWQSLRRAILGADAEKDSRLEFKPIRVITANDPKTGRSRELDDIRTAEENRAAAKMILAEVLALTSNDDIRLVASLAGGRKTMGAILHAAVSLLGRKQDRLTHILVNEPFDHPGLRPKFFYPGQPDGHHKLRQADGSERSFSGAAAALELADVPFAPLQGLFRNYLGRLPGEWDELVRAASGMTDELTGIVTIELSSTNERKWIAAFDGVPVELTGRDIPFFCFLYQRARDGGQPYASHLDAYDDFLDFLSPWMKDHPVVNLQFGESDWRDPKQLQPTKDHLRKRVDSLRSRLTDAGLARVIGNLFPYRGPLGFPPSRIRIP